LYQKKGHDFLKLIKIKILTVISGLLTLNGLIMLFLGLCNQVDKSTHFLTTQQAITLDGYTDLTIFFGVLSIIVFGIIFFASWVKSKQAKAA